MGSALLNPAAQAAAELHQARVAHDTPEELRRQVAARLAAHRERRLRTYTDSPEHSAGASALHGSGKSRVAAAVAERYANAQSYRAFLAAEAERAIQHAHAAAEVAARNAQAIAEAQGRLLDSLALQTQALQAPAPQALAIPHQPANQVGEFTNQAGEFTNQALWPELDQPAPAEPAAARTTRPSTAQAAETNLLSDSSSHFASATLPSVRIVSYDASPAVALPQAPRASAALERRTLRPQHVHDPEALALDEEISFRQAPVFEESPGPPMPIPANLIEFPRQLVAARKARPRYAEGPLRDEDGAASATEQLRIFEVHPAQISFTPEPAEPAHATLHTQWTSIWLDAPATSAAQAPTNAPDLHEHVAAPPAPARLEPARLSRRLRAASVDLAITAIAGLAFAAVSAGAAGMIDGQTPWSLETIRAVTAEVLHTVPAATLGGGAVLALVVLSTLLQTLFFTFSDATPGMRLARIGLCTFSDENPTRAAMRRRIPALVLSTGLLGLGFAWSLLDQDRLTWHDLISRMYQRSY